MCATPWYYFRNQMLDENVRFKLFHAQDMQGDTNTREYSKFKFFENLFVKMQ
jgi:hypothetical protein